MTPTTYTVTETAERLGCSRSAVEVHPIRIGTRVVFGRAAVDALLAHTVEVAS